MNEKETIVEIVKNYADKGYTSSQIGHLLRDLHEVPSLKVLGLKMTKICPSLKNQQKLRLQAKIVKLKKHCNLNNHDYKPKRKLISHLSKLWKLKWKQ